MAFQSPIEIIIQDILLFAINILIWGSVPSESFIKALKEHYGLLLISFSALIVQPLFCFILTLFLELDSYTTVSAIYTASYPVIGSIPLIVDCANGDKTLAAVFSVVASVIGVVTSIIFRLLFSLKYDFLEFYFPPLAYIETVGVLLIPFAIMFYLNHDKPILLEKKWRSHLLRLFGASFFVLWIVSTASSFDVHDVTYRHIGASVAVWVAIPILYIPSTIILFLIAILLKLRAKRAGAVIMMGTVGNASLGGYAASSIYTGEDIFRSMVYPTLYAFYTYVYVLITILLVRFYVARTIKNDERKKKLKKRAEKKAKIAAAAKKAEA